MQPITTLNLPAGTHWICTCGQSQNWPHCDGSHAGSALQPLTLELDKAQTIEISSSASVTAS